jgi:hypothetical protein
VEQGVLHDGILRRLTSSATFVRRNQRLARIGSALLVGSVVAVGLAALSYWEARKQLGEATFQSGRAQEASANAARQEALQREARAGLERARSELDQAREAKRGHS